MRLKSKQDTSKFDKAWKNQIEPNYQQTIDKIIILSKVCKLLHQSDSCEIPSYANNMKYDSRGGKFRKEFEKEIDDAITNGDSYGKKDL